METKNLTIETLSPIFIWKGEDYSKFDYTVEMEGEISIKIYDVNKLINDLPKYIKNKSRKDFWRILSKNNYCCKAR